MEKTVESTGSDYSGSLSLYKGEREKIASLKQVSPQS